MKCILKYLRRTKDLFLVYEGEELKLQGYTDSSFQSNPDDNRSTSEFMFTLNGESSVLKEFQAAHHCKFNDRG